MWNLFKPHQIPVNVLKDLQPGGGIQFNSIVLVTKTGILAPSGGLSYNDTIAVFVHQNIIFYIHQTAASHQMAGEETFLVI